MCGEWKQSQGDASATARAEGGGEQWMAVAARSGPMEAAAAAAPLSLRSSLVALSEKMKRRKEDRLAVVFRKEEKERRS